MAVRAAGQKRHSVPMKLKLSHPSGISATAAQAGPSEAAPRSKISKWLFLQTAGPLCGCPYSRVPTIRSVN